MNSDESFRLSLEAKPPRALPIATVTANHVEVEEANGRRKRAQAGRRVRRRCDDTLGTVGVSGQDPHVSLMVVRVDDTRLQDRTPIKEEAFRPTNLAHPPSGRPQKDPIEKHPAEPRSVGDLEIERVGRATEVCRR